MNIDQIIDQVTSLHPYKKIGDRSFDSPYNEGWSDACDMIKSHLHKLRESCPHSYRCASKKEIEERKIKSRGIGIWICEKCDIVHHSM